MRHLVWVTVGSLVVLYLTLLAWAFASGSLHTSVSLQQLNRLVQQSTGDAKATHADVDRIHKDLVKLCTIFYESEGCP